MAKGKKRAVKAAAAGEVPEEFSNAENFVDGIGYRAKCVIGDCDEVTDGGAVIRTGDLAGERFALCAEHRTPEGLAEAVADWAAASEAEPEGNGGGGPNPPA